ncbi:MAG: ABC transporter ATP-binding protein, partial [Armatimonadota bacterium]
MAILFRLIRLLRPYWPVAAGALLCTLAGTAVGLIPPKLIKLIIDSGIGEGRRGMIAPLAGGIVAVSAVRGILLWAQIYLMEAGAQGVLYDLRSGLYA